MSLSPQPTVGTLPDLDWPTGQTGWPPADAGVQAQPAQPARRKGPLLLALVAVAGVLAGAVGTAFLVTSAFISAAEDIGRGMSHGLGDALGDVSSIDGPAPDAGGPPRGPVEQFPPVEPGALGSDPALDAAARSCFQGDLQACDDLSYEAPPLSDYEDYGATCAGRVKRDAVPACTGLE